MSAPSWENLDDFFQLDENGGFATTAVFTLSDGSTRAVSVIFDDPQLDARVGGYVVETSDYMITAPEASLAGIERGDYVVINKLNYDVLTSPRPEGSGTSVVHLELSGAAL